MGDWSTHKKRFKYIGIAAFIVMWLNALMLILIPLGWRFALHAGLALYMFYIWVDSKKQIERIKGYALLEKEQADLLAQLKDMKNDDIWN